VPDTDIGVHGFFGDTAWQILCVFSPNGEAIISFEPRGTLGKLGVAEFFFESNEPPYEDFGYDALTKTFPEGDYAVHAKTTDGDILVGAARFSTVVAMAPKILSPQTTRDETGDVPVVPMDNVVVRWEASTQARYGGPVTIAGYQVVIGNTEWEGNGDNFAKPSYNVHVGPNLRELVVPAEFFDADTVYELEVIAIEDSGNQTIAGVSFFKTGE